MTAPIFTKSVSIEFSIPSTAQWRDTVQQKVIQMARDGKTDTVYYNNDRTDGKFGYVKKFVDQAAAQEWLEFITGLSSTLNRPIVTSSISNI